MQKVQLIAGICALACMLACGKNITESAATTAIAPKDSMILPKSAVEKPVHATKKNVLQQIVHFFQKEKTEKQLIQHAMLEDSTSHNMLETPNQAPEKPFEMPLLPVSSLMQSLSEAPKPFSIPSNEPTAIELPQGTQVLIPENAFMIEETGTPVKGNVLLLAKEYIGTKDILRANLSTVAPEGLLETGGMLYLEAQYDGKRCALQKDKRIQFLLPTQGRKKEKDMQLFSGERDEDGQLLWNALAPADFSVQDTLTRRYTTQIQSFKDFVNTIVGYVQDFSWLNMNRPVIKVKSVKVRQGGVLTDIDPNIRCPRNYFSINEFPVQYCGVKWGEKEKDTIGTFFKKEEKAAVYKVKVNADLITGNLLYPRYPGDLEDIPVGMSHYIMRSIRRHRWVPGENEVEFEIFVANKYKKMIEGKYGSNHTNGDCETHYRTEYQNYVKNFKPVTYSYSPARMSAEQQMNNYIFNSTKLGWINCDRFLNIQAKTNFKIDVGEASEAQAYLIFHKIRSVMTSSLWQNIAFGEKVCSFQGVPFREKITILLIKTENNKQYYALKDTQISNNIEKELDFQPLDRNILAELTQNLGQRFN